MVRDYKFRGKSLMTGKWLYGSLYWDGAEYYILPNIPLGASDYEDYIVDQNTIGQYTGMKDKHGNEICEGDIIRFRDSIDDIVEFRHGAFGYYGIESFVALAGNSNFTFNPYNTDKSFEVIGNVTDNVELLNNK